MFDSEVDLISCGGIGCVYWWLFIYCYRTFCLMLRHRKWRNLFYTRTTLVTTILTCKYCIVCWKLVLPSKFLHWYSPCVWFKSCKHLYPDWEYAGQASIGKVL